MRWIFIWKYLRRRQDELHELAVEANRAADRMIKRLDETIARVDRVLLEMNGRRRPGMLAGKSRE